MADSQPVALVTGAANGIGRAITEHLLHDGWFVAAFDIDAAALRGLPSGPNLATGHLDVADESQWDEALAGLSRLDLLVNNAGVLHSGPFTETPGYRHRAIVEVNVLGVIHGALAAFPLLARTPGSVMVNLASASAMYGQPDLATYSATKFAIRGLTEALDLEWAEHDIRVFDLWPLFVQTGMVDGMQATSGDRLGIHLTADDVATTLLKAVRQVRSKPAATRIRNPHIPVGRRARALATLAQVAPHWANRLMTKVVTGR
ncbi:MAG TPA: SDR family oxidoreductase [Dermatophilaceae bacterium]|nr:SDR family oxidoreductase [Dermatophilaceae bacterium]